MSKYKVGDKVRIRTDLARGETYPANEEKYFGYMVTADMYERRGTVVTITRDMGYRYAVAEPGDFYFTDAMFEGLVEDEKVFTNKDLKSGMFGVMSDGAKFVVVNDKLVYQDDGYDLICSFKNNMECISYSIDKVWTGIHSFRMLDRVIENERTYGELVYSRKRDTLYNGKVVCVDATTNRAFYTVGKIYQFKDGQITADNGKRFPMDNRNPLRNTTEIYNFEDWKEWSTAKFIEIKE